MPGPFDQMKDLYKMQKEARRMQKKMKKVVVSGESKDGKVKIEMNGVNEILDIEIDEELLTSDRKNELVKDLKRALEQARKALQKEMSKDFDLSDIQGMLGK